jgi:hypothetical protein
MTRSDYAPRAAPFIEIARKTQELVAYGYKGFIRFSGFRLCGYAL